MRIIGGHDYYDYCVGKFGFDSTRTYDRRAMKHIGYYNSISIAIAGVEYKVIKTNGRFYFKQDPELCRSDNMFLSGSSRRKTNLNAIPILS